jgi:integrase
LGKPVRRYYATKEEAQAALLEFERGTPEAREVIATLSGSESRDFLHAKQLLDEAGNGFNVLEAVRFFLRAQADRLPERTFAEACDAYIEVAAKPDTKYWRSLRGTKSKFTPLGDEQIQDVSSDAFWEILRLIPETTRAQHMRHLRAIFNYAIRKEFLAAGKNPIDRLDMPDTGAPREVEIYPVSTVSKYLQYALEYELNLVPYFTLGFFCGVRPEGEMGALEWSAVDWARARLNIRAKVAKGGRRGRQVEIPENAMAWLMAYRDRGGKVEGKVLPFTNKQLRDVRVSANKIAGSKWIQDGMRHSFASYHVAMYDDVPLTSLRMGHLGVMMLGRHYLAGVPKEEALAYFGIRPTEDGKVVAFKTA